MAVFITDVAVRWSDMDVFGHVNNACVVTLLEEARTELLFGEGARRGAQTLANGVVVVELLVRSSARWQTVLHLFSLALPPVLPLTIPFGVLVGILIGSA